jgi:hypothetical protein
MIPAGCSRPQFSPAFEEVLPLMGRNSTYEFMTTLAVNLPAHNERGIGGVIPPHAKLHYIVHLRGWTHHGDRGLSQEPINAKQFATEFPVDKGILAHHRMVRLFQVMTRMRLMAGCDDWPLQDTIILLTSGVFSYRYYQWLESAASDLVDWRKEAALGATRQAFGGADAGGSSSESGSSSGGAGSSGQGMGSVAGGDGSRQGSDSSSGVSTVSPRSGSGSRGSVKLMAASTVPSVTTVFAQRGAFLAAMEEASKHLYGGESSHAMGLSFMEWQQRQKPQEQQQQQQQ